VNAESERPLLPRQTSGEEGGVIHVTQYIYHEVGNIKTVTNARGKTTTYRCDDCDRKTRVDYPDSTYEAWTYRDDGRVWTHTDARGRQITYRYDADDRLAGSGSYVAINYPNDTDVQITRDKDGLITTTVDASGTTTNDYYPSTWLRTKTVSAGSSKTITYQYNGGGLVSNMAVSGESSFTYSYNARNQLNSLTNPNSVQITFTYDNGGRRTRVTRPGSYIEYVYNARNWLTDVRNRTTGGTTRYDATYYYQDGSLWDHTGNPLKRVENFGASNFTTTLRYDNLYRMTEETKRDSSNNVLYTLGYGYDAVGNRISRALGGVSTTYVYDNNDKLASASGGGQSASFTYDNNGNITGVSGTMFGSKTLVYDDENQLTSLLSGGVTDLYYYNALGQRYRARLSGAYWRYVYNGDRVLEETNDSGSVLARYTTQDPSYFSPLLHMWRSSSTSRFPLYDLTGSARGLVDASGAVTDTYELDAFGRQVSSTGSTVNPYKYDAAWGYISDPSGFQQLGYRFYWPEVGRFVQQDPIGDGMNWYAYVGNDPVIWVDPYGLWSASLQGYLGVGGGITFGWNPCGGFFAGGRLGLGLGVGGTFNPTGTSPGWNPAHLTGHPGFGGYLGASLQGGIGEGIGLQGSYGAGIAGQFGGPGGGYHGGTGGVYFGLGSLAMGSAGIDFGLAPYPAAF